MGIGASAARFTLAWMAFSISSSMAAMAASLTWWSASLARWTERSLVRQHLMQRFRSALGRESGGPLVWPEAESPAAPTLMCLRWPGRANALRLEKSCAQRGVATRRWYQPLLHRHSLPETMLS